MHNITNIIPMNGVTEKENFEDIHAACLTVKSKHDCNKMTVNGLYEELLILLLSDNYGSSSNGNCTTLLEYIREVFEIPQCKHVELVRKAHIKKPTQKTLSIQVDRAEHLLPMDSNGTSDAFVTVYIESNSTTRYNTAVVPSTINPSWKEHFSIPLKRSPIDETLIVEVWDFDAAESVGEKINKLTEVKGIRGFKKLLKEIALTASTGKHDNELIGRAEISLKAIPPTGIKSWHNLRKGTYNKSCGVILLHLHFSTEKSKVIVINEHINLLRIFLLHEFKTRNLATYSWCGIFNADADAIIKRHYIQNNLTEMDSDLCRWEVYTKFHETHSLSLILFRKLLKKLLPEFDTNASVQNNQFWEGYKRILPSCFVVVRSLRCDKFEETYGIDNLSAALEIIKKAEPSAVFPDFNLFPLHIYGWLGRAAEHRKIDANFVLHETIKLSAYQFLNKVYEDSAFISKNTLQHLIVILRFLINDLQVAIERDDKHFCLMNNINYTALLYSFYQKNIIDVFMPKITFICSKLKQLNVLDEEIIMVSSANDFKTGTLLFDLYLGIKRFTNIGSALCATECDLANKLYDCFYPAVANWLNISVIKTLTSIKKAVEIDEFIALNNELKHSSSALDTLSLFYQIKYFWEQMGWPNVEESYMFAEKIINDVCRCSLFYASRISERVYTKMENGCTELDSQASKEICYAINDINYITESLPLFAKEMKIDNILKKMAELRSTLEAERCSVSISNLICNAVDIAESISVELIEKVAQQIIPEIQELFQKVPDIQYDDSHSINFQLKNLEKKIDIFRFALQDESLNKLTDAICNKLLLLMNESIQKELYKNRQPLFFKNMYRILNLLVDAFNIGTNTLASVSNLKEVCTTLELYAMSTESVIHKFYEDQLLNQTTQNNCGQLTIKANLSNESLQIHILNAYQLLPINLETSCNSYVKIHFTPAANFIGVINPRTSVKSKTRCPLYDEHFCIKVTPEQFQNKNNILVFCVKNKDLFGLANYCIAECYLSFADIEKAKNQQIRINLMRPQYTDNKIIRVLESRSNDKQAKNFIRKLKAKSLTQNKIKN